MLRIPNASFTFALRLLPFRASAVLSQTVTSAGFTSLAWPKAALWSQPLHRSARVGLGRGTSLVSSCRSLSDAKGPTRSLDDILAEHKDKGLLTVLNVAEKNDAAKGIAKMLSKGEFERSEGESKFNKIYTFDYEGSGGVSTEMVFTSVSGHLLNYEFPPNYRKWDAVDPVELFNAPMNKMVRNSMTPIMATLRAEAAKCSVLIIWTDCDREGENIGFEIAAICKGVNPELEIYRARFSEITPHAVRRAVRALVRLNRNQSDAVDCRQELDLRIGATFTRFQTLLLRDKFPLLGGRLISYGSCQFPTLGFVIDRYNERKNFVVEPFWYLKLQHTKSGIETQFEWRRERMLDEAACAAIHRRIAHLPFMVTGVESGKKRKILRPLPLTEVELVKLASRKLGISAKETDEIAQWLYSQGILSYPRSETDMFSTEFEEVNLIGLVEEQTSSPVWGAFAEKILCQPGGPKPRKGTKTDFAHPPIHPVRLTVDLQGDAARIYEFIVRHFLACVSEDAVSAETTVEGEIGGEQFTAKGRAIVEPNYLDVYIYQKVRDKIIGHYSVGEQFEPHLEMVESKTVPPQLLSEADLISAMDSNGIGTDATRSQHIETNKKRLFIGQHPETKRFVPGKIGLALFEGYRDTLAEIFQPGLRAELERDLKLICEGKRSKHEILEKHMAIYRRIFEEAVGKEKQLVLAFGQHFEPYPDELECTG